jgi:Domain of unknown function (DUF4349)
MKNYFLVCLMLLMLASCNKPGSTGAVPAPAAPEAAYEPAPAAMADKMSADGIGGAEQGLTELSEPRPNEPAGDSTSAKKFIALRHHLQIETPASQMQAAFDAAIAHCAALNCQMLSANFVKGSEYNTPSASLSFRVPPRSVEIFLTGLAKNGEITQHGRDSEDKTNQVVDADARIKNLTELRDRLRAMLTDKSAKFKDLIEVETQLANTQSELDTIMGVRKVLSQETDLVAVNIDFMATRGVTEQGAFAPIARAFKNAGATLVDSLAMMITFIVGVLPWLLMGIVALWLVRRFWRKK